MKTKRSPMKAMNAKREPKGMVIDSDKAPDMLRERMAGKKVGKVGKKGRGGRVGGAKKPGGMAPPFSSGY